MKRKHILIIGLTTFALVLLMVPGIALAANGGGTGTLAAWGEGKGVLQGEGRITISGRGDLWVLDQAGDARIYFLGRGVKAQGVEGWTHYQGIYGFAYVTGSDFTVAFRGLHLHLFADGSGTFVLRGMGDFNTTGGGWVVDETLPETLPLDPETEGS